MTTGSNNPEPPQATVAATEKYDLSTEQGKAMVPTQITVQGKVFELKNMSIAQAQELYNVLGADDQLRVQGLAGFIKNFKAPLLSELPESLQGPGKVEAFVKHIQASGGKVVENTPDWIKELYGNAADTASKAPGVDHVRNIIGAINGVNSAVGTMATAANEAKDWVLLLPRATQYLVTRGGELWNSAGHAPTEDQAMAVATAYQGSLVASRREVGIFDKANARIEQFWSWLSNSSFGNMASAFAEACGNWLTGKGWNYSEALAAKEAATVEPRTYEQILNENLEQPVQAAAALRNAEKVADRDTAPLADTLEAAATNGAALYRDQNDNVSALNESGQSQDVKTPGGENLKASQVDVERFKEVSGSIGKGGLLAGGLGAVGAYKFTKGASQAVANRYWGDENGAQKRGEKLSTKSDDLIDRAAKAEKGGHLDKSARLLDKAEALADKSKASLLLSEERVAAHPKLNAIGNKGAAPMPKTAMGSAWNPFSWPERIGRKVGDLFGAATEPSMAKLGNGAKAVGAGLDHAPAAVSAGASAAAATGSSMWSRTRSALSGLRGLTGGGGGRWGVAGKLAGGAAVLGLAAVAPLDSAMAATDAKDDDQRSDSTKDAVVQTGGFVAAGTTVAKLGLGRASPWIAPITEGANFTSAAVRGDERGMVTSTGRLSAVGAGAAAGAGIGVWFFGWGAAPGAAIGGIVGGVADWLSGGSEKLADMTVGTEKEIAAAKAKKAAPVAVASNDGAAGPADEGLSVAVTDAQSKAQVVGKSMLAHSVKVGAVKEAPDSGLLGGFSFGKMDVFKGDFNPFS